MKSTYDWVVKESFCKKYLLNIIPLDENSRENISLVINNQLVELSVSMHITQHM